VTERTKIYSNGEKFLVMREILQ